MTVTADDLDAAISQVVAALSPATEGARGVPARRG
jgi:hypothetical protein